MKLTEVVSSKTAVFAYGRLNPPTTGHQKLVDKIKNTATQVDGEPMLFLSHSQDANKNPLDLATKIYFANAFFPGVNVVKKQTKGFIDILQQLQAQGYENVVVIAGSDRAEGFQKMIDTYNGKPDKKGVVPFTFKRAKVVSSGERDPDADDVSGMSASKMRQAASEGNFELFKNGVPGDDKQAKFLYNKLRQAMGIQEAAGVGIITKQNTTKDVKKGTLKKMMKGFKLI